VVSQQAHKSLKNKVLLAAHHYMGIKKQGAADSTSLYEH